MDPNKVMEVGRPNVHGVNNMDLLNMEWLSISPQRDDLKLLCEQNVSASASTCLLATGRNKWNRIISCCHTCVLHLPPVMLKRCIQKCDDVVEIGQVFD